MNPVIQNCQSGSTDPGEPGEGLDKDAVTNCIEEFLTDNGYEPGPHSTDDQALLPLTLVGGVLTVNLEDGGTQTIDLNSLLGSDDQQITTLVLQVRP